MIFRNREGGYECRPLPGIGGTFDNTATAFFEAWADSIELIRSWTMVDENSFDITGIIDSEGAFTALYELISFPSFLAAIPASFDLPGKYDQDG
ncbi:uncharacterized protein N7518_000503 [Penicillium psychrosexuale]|uniref:uncharacterized protein n=1 Tax=Penicillium psychrosexuale TaxID=1002107 RepID=UPI0025453BB7|nr:uncharacterized protein N7518_000503 [Penicillium psychrosexuale]KAJ5804200.1 hypothetical protein N7518_000503 [Penicillium psychrosexuale]